MAENKKSNEDLEAVEVSENELEDVAGGIWQGPDGGRQYPPGVFHAMGSEG